MSEAAFKRVLLKLSGESLMGSLEYGTDPERVERISRQVHEVAEMGVEVALVVGAGNIYRGLAGAAAGMDRATADYLGMLATVLNAPPVRDASRRRARTRECCRPSRSWRSPSRTYDGARSATWRKGAWSSSPRAPATRSSPPTRRPRCGRSRSMPRRS